MTCGRDVPGECTKFGLETFEPLSVYEESK